MGLKDIEEIENIIPMDEKRQELVEALIDYFGEEDTKLILNIALYFRQPHKYFYLRKAILQVLQAEDAPYIIV